jgi:FkbM family methyltransferase
MSLILGDWSNPWEGEGLLSKLLLRYTRVIPPHPAKIRIFDILAHYCFSQGVAVVDQFGVRMLVNPLDYIGHSICFAGTFEPLSMALARQLMSRGGIFLDVGANFGLYTCTLASLPGVKCIAVDASPFAITKLERNLQRNPALAVTVVNVALGARRLMAGLETPVIGDLGTTRTTTLQAGTSHVSHVVATVPLDEVLTVLSVGPIKLLKIDVEGSELEVFRGLDFSSQYCPENIIMEYCERVVRNSNDLVLCFELLRQNGYEPLTVTGEQFDRAQLLPEENIWWRRAKI